jgi:DNA-binding transcriptional ArsR family regulator
VSPPALARPVSDQCAVLIAERLQAIGQPLRIRLIDELERGGERSVQELAGLLGVGRNNASRHLAALYKAGIVQRRQEGRRALYRLNDATVIALYEDLAEGLVDRLQQLSERISDPRAV